ncbi:biotin--[acetyl-CoA-carboxylase] ligase [Geminicoccus harenae]|uniref:biotin--[acetyl-CoA-carboxylase] ligase n=2 Tax=Geminicoccus harenae TaxID=2498453 RepID=UPI001C961526|nr:biotin--[acetyl-CoA-carboxylase] ligase [Geminicoccus harenae]
MPSSTEEPGTGLVWRVERYPELPSTMDLVRERARAGAGEGLVVVAGRQTAGRGRHGRGWTSPAGNLYLTLLLRPGRPAIAVAGLALVAGLSLAEACAALGAPLGRLHLKWPNDLLLDGAKLAGILLESESGSGQQVEWVSIGMGVNIAEAPVLPDRPSAALTTLLPAAEPGAVEALLLDRLARNYAAWRQDGMAAITGAWSAYGLPPGTPILIRPGREVLSGTYVGIDGEGALLVDTGRLQRITAGEVLFAGEALAGSATTA